MRRVALGPDRPVGERHPRAARRRPGSWRGEVTIDPTPQEVPWTVPLDEDDEHARYDPARSQTYFAAATQAALVLAAFRAPYRGRSTPVNAWWGSFDLAVSLFSGQPADPPSEDFIMRNAMDAQEVAVGWWPGDPRYAKAAFYAYAHPAPEGFANATLSPAAARWDGGAGRVRARLGGRHRAPPTRTPRRSSSPTRRSATPAPPASGTRRWPPAPRGRPRRSDSPEGAPRRSGSRIQSMRPRPGVEHQVTPDLGRPDRVAPHSPSSRQLLDEAQPVPPEAVAVLGHEPGLEIAARIGDGDPKVLVEQDQIDHDQLV